MEQLEQLKHMRDEARKRIAATADYKLATSLDALIADLEEVLGVPSDDGEGAEGTDDAEADIEPAAATEETTTEVVVEVAEEKVEEAKPEEDDVSDLSRALAQQLENETATMSKAATADDDPLIPPAAPTNGSSSHSEGDAPSEDGEEEDALIRAMRELDEDLANADLGDDAKGAK